MSRPFKIETCPTALFCEGRKIGKNTVYLYSIRVMVALFSARSRSKGLRHGKPCNRLRYPIHPFRRACIVATALGDSSNRRLPGFPHALLSRPSHDQLPSRGGTRTFGGAAVPQMACLPGQGPVKRNQLKPRWRNAMAVGLTYRSLQHSLQPRLRNGPRSHCQRGTWGR